MGDKMNYLKEDENIEKLINDLIEEFKVKTKDKDMHSNVLDPFSSIIEASINKLDYENWLKAESTRQNQKTLQNTIGNLHQALLSNIVGVEDLGVGEVVDIVCHKKKIVAEIKNKFNTTKGNHKVAIYDDISKLLSGKYSGYTGYYVEIIPKKPEKYNKCFIPSDNTVKDKRMKKRLAREDIRIIDGRSFYELLTGDDNAIFDMHNLIAKILVKNYGLKTNKQFSELLNLAYKGISNG